MVFDLIDGGKDLVQIVAEAKAATSIYAFGKQQIDRLRGFIGERQKENAAKLSENTAAKLQKVSRDRLSPPSPSVVTPLLEAAVQESREELQDLWAGLLANSMIDGCRKVRRDLIDVLRQLEPADALVLKIIGLTLPREYSTQASPRYHFHNDQRTLAGLTDDDWSVSVAKLGQLGCLSGWNLGYEPSLLPFGRMLLAACAVE